MTFKSLCNDLTREAGISGGATIATVASPTGETARVVNWIRRADLDIQGLYFDWKFLWRSHSLTTQAGTATYTGPEDAHYWDRDKTVVAGNKGIEIVEYELWEGFDDGATGQPWLIILMPDGGLKLYPTPDDAYTVEIPYYRTPVAMVEDTDSSVIPEPFQDLIWMRAILKYAFYEAAPEVMERVRTEYPERLRALESHQLPGRHRYMLAQDPGPLVVIPE